MCGRQVWVVGSTFGMGMEIAAHRVRTASHLHFRQNSRSVVDVEERRKKCWSRILEERIAIPASEVKVYDNKHRKDTLL